MPRIGNKKVSPNVFKKKRSVSDDNHTHDYKKKSKERILQKSKSDRMRNSAKSNKGVTERTRMQADEEWMRLVAEKRGHGERQGVSV